MSIIIASAAIRGGHELANELNMVVSEMGEQ